MVICAVAVLLPLPVLAQSESGGGGTRTGTATRGAVIENIVVRARKREETQQTTPVTVTALSGEALDRQFAQDLGDLTGVIPNVMIQPVSQFRNAMAATIRGIGYTGINSEFDAPVAVYVDGFYYSRNTGALLDFFDIESVELLRGPQGTLFGRNALAGAINVRSKRPSGDFGVHGNVRSGNYGRLDFRGAIDMPIVEGKVAAKLAVLSQKSDGYYRNVVDGNSRFGGDDLLAMRPMIRFTPTDDFEFTLIGEYSRDRGDPQPNKNASFPGQTFCAIAPDNCVVNPWNYRHPSTPGHIPGDIEANANGKPFTIAFQQLDKNFSDTWGLIGEAIWETEHGTLTSITGYRDVDESYEVDSEGDPFLFFNASRPARVKDFSQELRFATSFDTLDVIFGAFYLNSDTQTAMEIQSALGDAIASFRNSFQKRDSVAVFVDVEYPVNDRFSIAGGVRYAWEKKEFEFGQAIPRSAFLAGAPVAFTDTNKSWSDLSPQVSLRYVLENDTLMYANWSRGFKSGGFNALAATGAFAGPYDTEQVDGFEVGIKGDYLDNRLRMNVAGFWQLFDGLQRQVVQVLEVNGQQLTNNAIINAAKATTRGVEFEFIAVPTTNLSLRGSVGYLDAYYRDFCADLGQTAIVNPEPCQSIVSTAVDLSDLNLILAPTWQASVGASYFMQLDRMGSLTLSADHNYASKMDTGTGNNAIAARRTSNITHASLRWDDPSDRFSVSLFGRNIFDKVYTRAGLDAGGTVWSLWVPTEPRIWGLELDVRL